MGPVNREIRRFSTTSGRLLDLGGGTGRFSAQLSGWERVIIDLDLDVLRRCRSGERVMGDVMRLPFRDEVFDLIIARGVLHHVPEGIEIVLSEAKRVLRRGGIIFVQDPGGLNPFAATARRLFPTDIHVEGERPLDPEVLLEAVSSHFQIKEVKYFHVIGYLIPHVVPRLPISLQDPLRRLSPAVFRIEQRLLSRLKGLRRFASYVQIIGRRMDDGER